MFIPVAAALAELRRAAADGRLGAVCARQGIELVVLFGSAVHSQRPGAARDVDVAVAFRRSGRRDLLGAVEDLAALVPGDHLDVMDLDRAGPVARVEALTKGEVLLETRRGAFTEREMSALGEYLETAYLRDALLRELAR